MKSSDLAKKRWSPLAAGSSPTVYHDPLAADEPAGCVGNLSGKSTRSSVLAAIADKLPDGITVTPALRGEILQLVRSIKIPREHKFPDEDFLAFRTAAGVARKPFGQWLLDALRGEVRRSVLAGAARGENVSQRQILYVQGLPKE